MTTSERQIEENIVRRMMQIMDDRFQQLIELLQPNMEPKLLEKEKKASTSASASENRTSSGKRTPSIGKRTPPASVPQPRKREVSICGNATGVDAAGSSGAQKVHSRKELAVQKQQQQQQNQQKKKADEVAAKLTNPTKSDEWLTVGKKGKVVMGPVTNQNAKKVAPVKNEPKKPAVKVTQKTARIGRVPRTAAVTLTMPQGGMSYLEAMKKAREEVKMEDLGIENVKVKRAATGGILLRIPGKEAKEKARVLSAKLEEAFRGTGAKVNAPMKMADLRVQNIVESVTQDEIAGAIAKTGECRVEEVKVGPIRSTPRGLGTAWARCPLEAAKKLQRAKTIHVCWGPVPVEVLEKRQVQCFRCLEKGHVAVSCPNAEDRSGLCFRCGKSGHKSVNCEYRAYCVVCAAKGKPADHRPGGKACPPPTRKELRANAKKLDAARIPPGREPVQPKPPGEAAQRHEEAMEADIIIQNDA